MDVKWFIGKVMDTTDPEKLGRVKAVLYEIDSQTEVIENLVWCYPDQDITNIPEVNDKYWFKVVDPPYLTKRFYTHKIQRKAYNDYNVFDTDIKSKITGFSGAYPDNKGFYTKLKNGVVFNSVTGETVIIGKNSYLFINSDDEIKIKAGTTALEKSVLGEKLKTLLDKILDEIIKITVPTPVGPSGIPVNLAAFTAIKTVDVPTILSPKVKNN